MRYQKGPLFPLRVVRPRRLRGKGESALFGNGLRTRVRSCNRRSANAIEQTDAIFIGGGSTFRLLKALQDLELLEPIHRKVKNGASYIGSSAGSNVAGPTIKTTKDMPIVQPGSFDSLGLVPFQISPHYLDPDPNSTHMGETQEERILQFLEENETPVVGIRKRAWLLIENGTVTLKGETGARIFRRGQAPVEVTPGAEISKLVGGPDAG